MKILSIRFLNLNSLRGETYIDFRDPAFAGGLFAITGPTGAGKSTILDAICLALYHCTPRLGLLTAATNELMTQHTGGCWSEVEFESNGQTYRARWGQRRSRDKPGGKLQPAEVEFAHGDGRVITTSINDKKVRTEEITGLSFDQFMRSVMLAQGGFAQFLVATHKDRADLLEKLTGTEIYSLISARVYERTAEATSAEREIRAFAGGVDVLAEEDRSSKQGELSSADAAIGGMKPELEGLRTAVQWRTDVAKAQSDRDEADAHVGKCREKADASKDELAPLEPGEDAERLRPTAEAMDRARTNHANAIKEHTKLTEAAEDARRELARRTWLASQTATRDHANAKRDLEDLDTRRAELERQRDTIDGGEQLGEQIVQWRSLLKQWQEAQARSDRAAGELKAARYLHDRACKQAQDALKQAEDAQSAATDAKDKARLERVTLADDLCNASLMDLRLRLGAIQSESQSVEKLIPLIEDLGIEINAMEEAGARRQEAENQRRDLKIALDAAAGVLEAAEQAVSDRRLIVDQERLIRDLAEHRRNLREGEPCALCGSTVHPAVEEYRKLDPSVAEGALETAVRKEKEARDKLADVRKTEGSAATAALAATTARDEADVRRQKLEQRRDDILTALLSPTVDLGELRARSLALGEQVEAANERLMQLEQRTRDVEALEEAARTSQTTADKVRSVERELQTTVKALITSVAERGQAHQEREKEADDCRASFVDDLPDRTMPENIAVWLTERTKEWSAYGAAVKILSLMEGKRALFESTVARAAERDAHWDALRRAADWHKQSDWEPAVEQLNVLEACVQEQRAECDTLTGKLSGADSRIAATEEAVIHDARTFEHLLTVSPFESETDFRTALLEPDGLQQLRELRDTLQMNLRDAGRTLDDRQQRLADVLGKAVTERTSEDLSRELQELEAVSADLHRRAGQLRGELEQDGANRARIANYQRQIEASELVHTDWQHLNGLIGSADGNKFRLFAQGLTLDHLVHLANKHLRRLDGGRYRIARKDTSLDLEVIDGWQADASRSANTLSGGESFLVSLALALGLSDLVSQRTSIDSFFLDEGFGTLDPDSLDIALDALDRLNAGGKLIGVISHVAAVKERLPVQVQVVKHRGVGNNKVVLPSAAIP